MSDHDELCTRCGGNGSLPLRNEFNQRIGIETCPRCHGRCYDPAPRPSQERPQPFTPEPGFMLWLEGAIRGSSVDPGDEWAKGYRVALVHAYDRATGLEGAGARLLAEREAQP